MSLPLPLCISRLPSFVIQLGSRSRQFWSCAPASRAHIRRDSNTKLVYLFLLFIKIVSLCEPRQSLDTDAYSEISLSSTGIYTMGKWGGSSHRPTLHWFPTVIHRRNKSQTMACPSGNRKGRYTHGGLDHPGTRDVPPPLIAPKGTDQFATNSGP